MEIYTKSSDKFKVVLGTNGFPHRICITDETTDRNPCLQTSISMDVEEARDLHYMLGRLIHQSEIVNGKR